MSLKEIAKHHVQPHMAALDKSKLLLEKQNTRLQEEEQKSREANEEVSRLASSISSSGSAIAKLHARAEDITKEIVELRRSLGKLKEREQDANQEYTQAKEAGKVKHQEYRNKQKAVASTERAIEQIHGNIEEAEDKVGRCEDRVRREQHAAFEKYMETLWEKLLHLSQQASSHIEGQKAYEELLQKKNQEPLHSLWQERQEWQRIHQSSAPAGVKDTAKERLDEIASKIEKLFPGALSVESMKSSEELEELYFYPKGDQGDHILFLPIPTSVCTRLDNGFEGAKEKLAATIIWEVSQFLGHQQQDKNEAFIDRNFLALSVQQDLTTISNSSKTISLNLLGGGTIEFFISELEKEFI